MLSLQATAPRTAGSDSPASTSTTRPAGFATMLQHVRAAPAPAPAPAPAANAAQAAAAARATTPAQAEATPARPEAEAQDADAASADAAPAHPGTPALTKSASPGRGTEVGKGAPRGDAADADAAARLEPRPADTPTNRPLEVPPPVSAPPDVPIDASVLHWFAGRQRERTPEVDRDALPGAKRGAAVTADSPIDAMASGAQTGAARSPRSADAKAERAEKATPGVMPADAPSGQANAGDVTLELRGIETKSIEAIVGSQAAAPAPTTALAAPATLPHAAPAPVAVSVAAAPFTPEFAGALGVQVSVLARNGVQQAELHLNPAEMGPVSIQIVMDGSRAHVQFGADVAATRQAIEAGLPELASALADAGFTLAGGGVSQHSRPRGEAHDSGASDGIRRPRSASVEGGDAASRAGTATRRIVPIGGIDLFA